MRRVLLSAGIALTALAVTSTAYAAPSDDAGCMGALSALFASDAIRDDIQLLHNTIFKEVLGMPPGHGFAQIARDHGSATECLEHIPPGLEIPPHP